MATWPTRGQTAPHFWDDQLKDYIDSADAFINTTALNAQTLANSATTTANNASTTATAASATASAAQTTASAAQTTANTAQSGVNDLNKKTPFLTPEMYGAVGDGTTDDTAALQAAFDAAYNAGGATVILSKRYGWSGDLKHRGAISVWGTALRKQLVTDDHMDRGLVALSSTSRYWYGQWSGVGSSTDDNPGPIQNLVIDGAGIGGSTNLFFMECVDGALTNVHIVNAVGNCVQVAASQNTVFESCFIGNAGGNSIDFITSGQQGAGQIKFNNCYIQGSTGYMLHGDTDPAQFYPHDIYFNQCLFEQRISNAGVAFINAGDWRFDRCTFTYSINTGTPANNTLFKISQTSQPTFATVVGFDNCYFNGGGNTTKPLCAVLVDSTGGVGNIVRFTGFTYATNVQAIVGVKGATVASLISLEGATYRGGSVNWFDTSLGGSLFGTYRETSSPTKWTMETHSDIAAPISVKRVGDSNDRFQITRDGGLFWYSGSDSTVQGSLTYDSTADQMNLSNTVQIANAWKLRPLSTFVTTAGQAVPLSAAETAAPAAALLFAANNATANLTLTDGGDGSQYQLLLVAGAVTGTSVTWPSNVKFNGVAPQPVANSTIIVSLVQYSGNWYAVGRVNDVTSVNGYTGAVTLAKSDVGLSNVDNTSDATKFTNTPLTGNPTAPTPTAGDNDTSVATTAFVQTAVATRQPTIVSGTTAAVAGSGTKNVTISGYTPVVGDVLALKFTNGTSVGNPSIVVNGGASVPIALAGITNTTFPALDFTFRLAINGLAFLYYDGTNWQALGTYNSDAPTTQAIMEAGTSTATVWVTPQRVKQAVANAQINTQTANYTLSLTDAGKRVEANSASGISVTVPPNSSVAFSVGSWIEIEQYGAGQLTIAPGAGVTLRGPVLVSPQQYSVFRLYKRATDEWVVTYTNGPRSGASPVYSATSADSVFTVARTATVTGYTPTTGDILALTCTNGMLANFPTLAINGGSAVAIQIAGAAAVVEQTALGAGGTIMLYYTGSVWAVVGAQMNWQTATTAQMQAGTDTTQRWMTPQLVGQAVAALSDPVSTTTALAAIGNAVNTTGKYAGKHYFNTTTNKPVWATGATAGSTWVDATGTVAHTPV